MKTFELDEMGVQEMDASEIKETDGGFGWVIAVGAIGINMAWNLGEKFAEYCKANGI